MNRIEFLSTRIAGLRAALATDAELQTVRQYGSPDEFARAEELNESLDVAIARYEVELAELVSVQGDPLATAWLEYRQARQAYAEARRTRGGFSSEPKHPREVVRAADQRLAEAYMRVDDEVVRLHKERSGKGNTPGYPHACKMNFGGLPGGSFASCLTRPKAANSFVSRMLTATRLRKLDCGSALTTCSRCRSAHLWLSPKEFGEDPQN